MLYLIWVSLLVVPAIVFAQAFGEYGRAVGSVPHGQGITGVKTPGGGTQGGACRSLSAPGWRGGKDRSIVRRRIVGPDGSGCWWQRLVYG